MKTSDVIGQNYTGPYVSNGKFQKSVAFGDQAPVDALDSASRLHDSVYALYGPGNERRAADSLYKQRTDQLDGVLPALAGTAVVYGNAGMHSLGNLTSAAVSGFRYAGLPGLLGGIVYGGVKNMSELYSYVTHTDEAKKKVLATELLDPYPEHQLVLHEGIGGSTKPEGTLSELGGKSLKVEGHLIGPTRPAEGSRGSEMGSASAFYNPPLVDGELTSVSHTAQWLGGGEIKTMVKKNQQKKKAIVVQVPKTPKQQPKVKRKKPTTMSGAIASITTAPVAIGNSVRGSENIVVASGKNGVIVRGRDFMFAPIGTGNVTTWTMCGGSPLSPAAFADTTLATYMRLYAKFRFRSIVAHYITSSPTSANGDVMFYYGKDRSSVFLNQTSPQLLGFVLSDPNTVIGPQWTNHSAALKVTGDWKLTDYGMHAGLEEYADGELFLLSKTSTTDSPGYVLFDYVIEFAEHQLQPRLLSFPIPRIQWFQTNIAATSLAVSLNQSVGGLGSSGPTMSGNNLSGASASLPSGAAIFDVFKVILDVTNSNPASWTNCTAANIFNTQASGAGSVSLAIQDGTTLYAVYLGSNKFSFYVSAEQAMVAQASTGVYNSGVVYGVAATVTYNLQVWMSYIGSLGSLTVNPNY